MSVADRLAAINGRIATACQDCGRDPSEVTLVAVSKNHPVEAVQAAYDAGHRDFGESRWQEFQSKVHRLPTDIRWHFIGKVQSNKARNIAMLASTLHTLENERQLIEIAKQERTLDAFIQVNIAEEPQKSGIFAQDLDTLLKHVLQLDQVRFCGLMTIGPAVDDPEEGRHIFRQLATLNQSVGGKSLSMGMSHDFEVALQEGATHIRVGSAIFGERPGH